MINFNENRNLSDHGWCIFCLKNQKEYIENCSAIYFIHKAVLKID